MHETITDFIRKDLEVRLRTGEGLPEKLTLKALSDHYRVSLTPVRLAVQGLIRGRVLRRRAGGRLEVDHEALARPSQQTGNAPPERPTGLAGVEARLTAEVLQRSLRGEAAFLREEATAERFRVGRTVLRQALHRLAGKGLIEHLPRRGWRVRTFDEADMRAYLQIREAMELKALDLARPRLVRADLERMLDANSPDGDHGASRLNNDLHRYFIDRAGNRYIREFFERFGPYYSLLFDYAAPEAQVERTMARQHREILEALLRDDWQAARHALARHIRAQRRVLQRVLGRANPSSRGRQDRRDLVR